MGASLPTLRKVSTLLCKPSGQIFSNIQAAGSTIEGATRDTMAYKKYKAMGYFVEHLNF